MRGGGAVARRYARALYGLAAAEARQEPVGEELTQFQRLLDETPELRDALTRPWVKAAAKRAVVVGVAERLALSPLARNFLALVAQRRRLDLLPDMLAAYRLLVDEAAGRIRARVRSAIALTDDERGAIRERLGRRLGRTVLLQTEVDPALLGGFVAEVGSRTLDATLQGQLDTLREQIVRDSGGGT